MKTSKSSGRIRAGATALALLGSITWAGTASAAGTLSGTSISNLSTLTYAVGGVTQPVIESSAAGNSTAGVGVGVATSFTVDNKVNLSVLEVGSAASPVTPGSIDRVTTFTVSNLGNTSQGYTFAAANQVGGAVISTVADTIEVSNFRIFVDGNGNGTYEVGADTATAVSTLAPDGTIAVFVLADIPAGATNGQQANVTLTATTTTAGGAVAVTETAGADTAGVDIVFADAATTELEFVGTSAARNAQGTARDAYRIASAVISVSKTALLICDPFNGSGATRKNIPGAIVRWTITISNAGTATSSASLAQVADTLATTTTFDPNLVTGSGAPATATSCTSASGAPESAAGAGFKIDVTGDTRAAGAGGVFPAFLTTAVAGNDGASHNAGAVAIDYSIALPAGGAYSAGELKPGESVVVYFNATIN
ncbi:MAG: hypothetical protein ABL860_05260 [Candidatus Nitrotoga sp.]